MDSAPAPLHPPGTVLVLGAGGFIGAQVAATLRAAGWKVLHGVRGEARGADHRHTDLTQLTTPESWQSVLAGVDAVVNAAGILRESGAQRFATIHVDAPLACARACVDCGIRTFVQISALGAPDDGEFIASKHRGDAGLLALALRVVVLRPSVVYSVEGSCGGTSLLRALAAMPCMLPVPGHGEWQLQPIDIEDLARGVDAALRGDARGVFELGGPKSISLLDYLRHWRAWLGLPSARVLRVPRALVGIGAAIGEYLGRGPMGGTMWRMLQRGNVVSDAERERTQQALKIAPRSLDAALAAVPSQTQDRWHAQLYFLAPVLRGAVVTLFLLSAWVGFATPAEQIVQLTAGSMLYSAWPVALARVAAVADLVLAAWLLWASRPRPAIAAMIGLVLTYSVAFGAFTPALWLDPLGGLAKNLVVLPALAVLWVLAERR